MIQLQTKEGLITFNSEQEEATARILRWYNSSEYFFLLAGYAGTGKSTISKYILQQVKAGSERTLSGGRAPRICVAAPTHKAKKVIEKATGYPGHTLQRLLGLAPDISVDEFDPNKPEFKQKKPAIIDEYDLIVLDEGSMTNEELFKYINKALTKTGVKTKMLILADPAQLPPVKEKLSVIFSSPLIQSSYLLTMVERQAKDNPALLVLDNLRNDVPFELVDSHRDGEGIAFLHGSVFRDEAIKAFISEEYIEDPDYAKILCRTNDMCAIWNRGIRKAKMDSLHPGKEILPLMQGDVLMAHSGYEGKIQNSNDYLVLRSEKSQFDITYPGKEGKNLIARVKTYAVYLANVDTGGQVFTHVLDQSDENNVKTYMKAYWAYTNAASKNRSAWVHFFNFRSWVMIMTPISTSSDGKFSTGKDLDYGYAITVYRSQGSSYTNVFVDGVDIANLTWDASGRNKLRYVSLSRMRKMAYYRIS